MEWVFFLVHQTTFFDVSSRLFIPLSDDFISYLKQDGIILPEGCEFPQFGRDEASNDNSDPEWSEGEEEEDPERGDDNVSDR